MRTLVSTLAAVLWTASVLHAQGFLPMVASSGTAASPEGPALIGQRVPEGLIVTTDENQPRPLLSYKAPLELLAVLFLSPNCPQDTAALPALRRFQERYRDWRVAMLVVDSAGSDETAAMRAWLKAQKMSLPVVRDGEGKAARMLKANVTPTLVVIDEGGFLRYRGPFQPGLDQAMDALIGHLDAVKDPEPAPPGGCAIR
jgi:hypothetical protein